MTDEGKLRFRHALFGEAVYDDLLPGERAQRHRALAEALASDPELAGGSESIGAAELARHWYAAHDVPAALAAAVRAGFASRSAGALAEAARQFGVALELWDQVPNAEQRAGIAHAMLLQQAGDAAHLAADHDQGAALLTRAAQAFEAEGDVAAAAIARTRLGRGLWSAGRTNEALEAHSRAVELMPATPTAERAEVLALLARTLMLKDQIEESLPVAEEALAIAQAVGARQAEGHALNTLGVDLGELGERERGIEHLRAALQLAIELNAPDDIGSAYVNLGNQIDQAGRIEEAAELGIEGIAACELAGVGRLAGAFVASEVALRLIRLGRYERAERLVADALELIREIIERANDPQWVGPFAAAEVELALWRGDADAAASIAERALSLLSEAVVMVSMTTPLHAHALRAEADRREQARARSEPEQPGRADELRDRLEGLLGSSAARGPGVGGARPCRGRACRGRRRSERLPEGRRPVF